MEDIKNYKAASRSISKGQVLPRPYSFIEGEIIVNEMAESLAMDLMRKGLYTNKMVLTISYEKVSEQADYRGLTREDYYGRRVPIHGVGTLNLDHPTNIANVIIKKMLDLYKRIGNPKLLIRRVNIRASSFYKGHEESSPIRQLDFLDYRDRVLDKGACKRPLKNKDIAKFQRLQESILRLKERYGKNIILRGVNFEKGATMRDRNGQIGGHRA